MFRLSSLCILLSLQVACRTDKTITAVNSSPKVVIMSHSDGATVDEGVRIQVQAQVSDSNDPVENLETAWYYGSVEVCPWSTPDAGGGTFCDILPTLQENTVRVEVRDPQSAGAVASITLDVQETNAPTAEILEPMSTTVYYSDQLVSFAGVVDDAEDLENTLIVEWNSSLDGVLPVANTPNASGEVDGAVYLTEGEHYIRLTVTDSSGKSDSDNVTISVGPPNEVPLCSIVSPQNYDSVAFGETVVFSGSATDANIPANALDVRWISDKDGEIATSTPNTQGEFSLALNSLSLNTHSISLEVRDELGELCTDSILFTVGSPPTVQITSPTNNQVFNEGEAVSFVIAVNDAQDPAPSISLDWSLNGQPYTTLVATSSGIAQFSEMGLEADTYNLRIVATDTDGLTDSAQVSFVVNALPTQPVISISPNQPTTNDALTLNILTPSIDPDGSTVTNAMQWYKNNVSQTGQQTASVPSSLTSKNDTWTVRVTPNDGTVDGPYAEASVTIQNIAPSVSGVAISPSAFYNSDTITCSASITDPDDTITPSYQWAVNGQSYSGASLNLASLGINPNTSVTCTVTANDGIASPVSASASGTVGNRAPTVNSVAISPSTFYNSDTLTCSATISDADTTLTPSYQWTVNGQSYSGASLNLASLGITPNTSVTCTVTANDGIASPVGASASGTTANRAPSLSNVQITPNTLYSSSTPTCSFTSSDADGETLGSTIHWYSNNSLIGSGSSLALLGLVTRSAQVSCSVTVTDATTSTTLSSNSISVTNTAPSAITVALSSTNTPNAPIEAEDDLICTVTTPSTDIDGDTVYYVYTWTSPNATYVGNPTTSTTDTFLGATPTIPGNWTCSVQANDGVAYTASVIATITVDSGCIYGEELCPGYNCEDILNNGGSQGNGVYWIDPDGNGTMEAYCDMNNGGWTLLLKSSGDTTLHYDNALWIDTNLLNQSSIDTSAVNAKLETYTRLPISELRGCFPTQNNHCIYASLNVTATARSIFAGGSIQVGAGFNGQEYNGWSWQPNCHYFGVNTPFAYRRARFGFTANQENDCSSNDTAIGFGLGPYGHSPAGERWGSGQMCLSSQCTQGMVEVGFPGLLYGR